MSCGTFEKRGLAALLAMAAASAVACKSKDDAAADAAAAAALNLAASAVAAAKVAAPASPDAPAPLAAKVPAGVTKAGRTPAGDHYVDAFRYQLPKNAVGNQTFVEARDACLAEGLDLCSREQLDIACATTPEIAKLQTWTTSYAITGQVWVRGGQSCDQLSAADPFTRDAARAGLCCERKPAVEAGPNRTSDALPRSVSVYMTAVQDAMNSRDPAQVLELAADEFYLYSDKKWRTRDSAKQALGFDLKNGPEFDNRLVRCGAVIESGGTSGAFLCEAVTVRKLNAKPSRELAFYDLAFRFVPPHLKYDTWAVGSNIVRAFTLIDGTKPAPNAAHPSSVERHLTAIAKDAQPPAGRWSTAP